MLSEPEFFADSIRGFVPHPDSVDSSGSEIDPDAVREVRTTIGLADIRQVETRDLHGLRSVGAAVGGAAFAVAGVASVYVAIGALMDLGSWGN